MNFKGPDAKGPGSIGADNDLVRCPLTHNPFSRHDEVFHATAPPPPASYLLQEDGSFLLQEDLSRIIIT